MAYVFIAGTALFGGLVVGFFTFRQKQRWCPICGVTMSCPLKHTDTQHSEGGSVSNDAHANELPQTTVVRNMQYNEIRRNAAVFGNSRTPKRFFARSKPRASQ